MKVLACFIAGWLVVAAAVAGAQSPSSTATAVTIAAPTVPERPGVFLLAPAPGPGPWQPMAITMPNQVKASHGFLSSLSYGAVAVREVAEFAGQHAGVSTKDPRPVLCVAHLQTPAAPVLVRLQEQKTMRQLDVGKLHALPLVGQSKMAQADANAEVPLQTEQLDTDTFLLQPAVPLPAGEYAIMFGTENMAVYPFTVASQAQ